MTLSEQLAYLGRSLTERARQTAADIDQTVEGIMRQNAAAGRLGSGNTLNSFREAAERIFVEAFEQAAKFAFNLTEQNDGEIANQLSYFAARISDIVMDKIKSGSSRLGLRDHDVAPHVANIRSLLDSRKERLIDDFKFGMLGNDQMKKDSVVNIVSNLSNSPGAIQQVGIVKFSQSAFVQQHQPLIAAIDAALESDEFRSLKENDKQGFHDVAEVVKEEASKENPDAEKLKRWSDRLIGLGKELGMRVAVSEIVHVLGKIFGI